jgi:hypothetical protein
VFSSLESLIGYTKEIIGAYNCFMGKLYIPNSISLINTRLFKFVEVNIGKRGSLNSLLQHT